MNFITVLINTSLVYYCQCITLRSYLLFLKICKVSQRILEWCLLSFDFQADITSLREFAMSALWRYIFMLSSVKNNIKIQLNVFPF